MSDEIPDGFFDALEEGLGEFYGSNLPTLPSFCEVRDLVCVLAKAHVHEARHDLCAQLRWPFVATAVLARALRSQLRRHVAVKGTFPAHEQNQGGTGGCHALRGP